MKAIYKFLIIAFVATAAYGGYRLISSSRTPYTIARKLSSLKIPESYKVEMFEEQWLKNGDGECLIIFQLNDQQAEELCKEAEASGYKQFPIINAPDNTIHNYISPSDSAGYYKLVIDSLDSRNYNISAFSIKKNKLIVYCSVF